MQIDQNGQYLIFKSYKKSILHRRHKLIPISHAQAKKNDKHTHA